MGAVGTQRVLDDLKTNGHKPIVLERGSTSFKIWKKIKIKRIRVPDILCLSCGRKVESRAKTAFEISMSHSISEQERAWDYGLNDNDYVALVVCTQSGDRPIDWKADDLVQYVSVKKLRSACKKGLTKIVAPKGAEEGYERRIEWPASAANYPGKVELVNTKHIKYCRLNDGRPIPKFDTAR